MSSRLDLITQKEEGNKKRMEKQLKQDYRHKYKLRTEPLRMGNVWVAGQQPFSLSSHVSFNFCSWTQQIRFDLPVVFRSKWPKNVFNSRANHLLLYAICYFNVVFYQFFWLFLKWPQQNGVKQKVNIGFMHILQTLTTTWFHIGCFGSFWPAS